MELFAADGHDAGGCERVTGKSGMRPRRIVLPSWLGLRSMGGVPFWTTPGLKLSTSVYAGWSWPDYAELLPERKRQLGRSVRASARPFGPEAVGDGPEGTGMQWRITIVSSLTITSLTRSRTIRCRSRTSRVSAARPQTCQERREGFGEMQMRGAVASLFHQRVQLVSQRLLALTQQRHPLAQLLELIPVPPGRR